MNLSGPIRATGINIYTKREEGGELGDSNSVEFVQTKQLDII